MALWNRRPNAIVASAGNVSISDKDTGVIGAGKAIGHVWQAACWLFFDELGEIKFAARCYGANMAKVRIMPALRLDDGSAPVALDEIADLATKKDDNETLLYPDLVDFPEELISGAADEMNRIKPETGELSDLIFLSGINDFVAGEYFWLGLEDAVTGDESWSVRSVDELAKSRNGPGWALCDDRGQLKDLPEGKTTVIRFWQPHPRRSSLPDSSMRGAIRPCEQLLLLARGVKGTATSRLHNNIMIVSNDIELGNIDPTKPTTPLGDEIMRHITTPILDEASSSGVVPLILRCPGEQMDKAIKMIDISRPFETISIGLREELRGEIATAIDMPAEVLKGKAGMNHWSAWSVDEDAWKTHFYPAMQRLTSGWTHNLWRPGMIDRFAGNEKALAWIDRMVLWFDGSDVVVKPNRAADAEKVFKLGGLSWDSLRDATGFNDGDAPTPEERVEISTFLAATRSTGNRDGGTTDTQQGQPGGAPSQAGTHRIALTAAVNPANKVARLGAKLLKKDIELRTRIATAGDSAVRHALNRAGARVKARVSSGAKNNPKLREYAEISKAVSADRMLATLGPGVLLATGLTEDELIADSLEELGAQWDEWVSNAQDYALESLDDALPGDLDGSNKAATEFRQSNDRMAGWSILAAGMTELIRQKLYSPDSNGAPIQGEYDPSLSVSMGMIRNALNRAGGAGSSEASGGYSDSGYPLAIGERLSFGVALGASVMDLAHDSGIDPEGYTWSYGVSVRSFEPHLELDGYEFADWTDEGLANKESWPPVETFMPNDHDGCSCDVTPSMILRENPAPEFNPTGERLDDIAASATR